MKSFLNSILNNIDDPVFVKDHNHVYLTVNSAYCKWLNVDKSKIIGKTDFDFFPKEYAEFFQKKDKEVFASGENQEIEEPVTKHTGEALICRTKKSTFKDENGNPVLVGIIRDINQLKTTEKQLKIKTQEAEAANRAKSLFLANMSHELRTPLNTVIGFTDLLLKNPGSRNDLDILKGLQSSANNLFSLLDNILDISKIESGKEVTKPTDFEIHELLEEIEDQFSKQFKETNSAYKLSSSLPSPFYIKQDRTKIRQVLVNLISNALKFAPSGQVKTELSLSDQHLQIQVCDTGPGVSKGFENSLFDIFSREDHLEKIHGSGLGLSISKKIMDLLGGEIKHEHNTPTGACFTITFPFEAGKKPRQEEDLTSPLPPLNLLVAEDNDLNQLLISNFLNKLGHHFDLVNDGRQALEKLKTNRYDIILLDMRMPNLDGYETQKQIKQNPAHTNTPIIAPTANTLKKDITKIKKASMIYLSKPINLERLQKALAKAYLKTQ